MTAIPPAPDTPPTVRTSPSSPATGTPAAGPRRAAAHRSRCTWLVAPGGRPGRFEAARNSGADVVLLDLEDSVPLTAKDAARAEVLSFVQGERLGHVIGGGALGVRVNALDTIAGLKDVLGLDAGPLPALLLIPKVEAARDIELVAQLLSASGRQCDIWALIETPRAIQNLSSILGAPLAGVCFGAADYATAAGCQLSSKGLWYPRAALAAQAAAAGLLAVDSPYFGLEDPDGLRRETEEGAALGFSGKVAIHPRQLPVIQAVFRPTPQDVEAARAVVQAADRAGGGITTVDGRMVGPPLVAAARALTVRADAMAPLSTKEKHDGE
ncbi:HpcH/HpaI aldolase/citrate lyase family protein [Streptomyces sp. NPDC059994]|uniref:HpcH/HpaI aldolase/citrate lyase family protein n=1 Tax=Streptomyces sp. NPDC059994 TaxID=3347029 RepID=UPI003682AFA9